MTGASKTVVVRVTPELRDRIDAARGLTARETWLRALIEAELERIEDRAVEAATASPAPVSRPGRRSPASAVTPAYVGCQEHPAAGAIDGRGVWWCAEPGCSHRARAVAQ